MADTTQEKKTRNLHITLALKNPGLVFDNGWYLDPAFCAGFFDCCEDRAMVLAPEALELARRAVQIAETNGDPHLIHHSYGVLSHAYLACPDLFWAGKTLDGIKDAALACCPTCRSRFFRRQGDQLGEERKVRESLEALDRCLAEGAGLLDDDAYGRIYFVRAISHHFAGNRGRALADAGEALRRISLESPRGFFLDTIACIAVFLGGGDPRHDEIALEHLMRFQERIKGLRSDWGDVRTRHTWAAGHILARLGDVRRAGAHLESAHRKLLDVKHGLTREAVASGLDVSQFRCRNPELLRRDNQMTAILTIKGVLRQRPELPDDQRRHLEELLEVLHKYPDNAFAEIGAFRRSFVAPVPGILGERMGRE